MKKTILKRTILEKKPISVPGEIKRIPFNIKRENVNNFVNKRTKFHISPIFIKSYLSDHFGHLDFIFILTDSGSLPRKYG